MIVVASNHLNSFLYFNKIYNHHYCQVKPSYVYDVHSTPHDYCRVRYELCVLYELELYFLNPLSVDFKSQSISSSI